MKKIISFILTASVCTAFVPSGSLNVSASENDFKARFFPNGTISAPPRAPYLVYTDRDDDSQGITAETEMFYELSSDLLNMNFEVAVLGESGFLDEYGVELNGEGIQIDVKFDDGPWLSQSYSADYFDYGYNLDPYGNIFLLRDDFPCSNLERIHYLDQGWLEYYDEEDETAAFLKPYVRVLQDENEIPYIQFDTDSHRVSMRYRYFVTYFPDGYSSYTTSEGNVIFSDWSPESSFGAGGYQNGIGEPSGISAPDISDFTFVQNQYEFYDVKYRLSVPEDVINGIRYYYINDDFTSDVYEIETQIRINGGEWVDVMTEDSMFVNSGVRTAEYSAGPVPDNSTAEVHARIVDIFGNESGWSKSLVVKPDYIEELQESFIAQALVTEKKTKKDEKNGAETTVQSEKAGAVTEPPATVTSIVGTDKHGFDIVEVSVVENPSDAGDSSDGGDGNTSPVKKWAVYILMCLVVVGGAAAVTVVARKGKSGTPVDVTVEDDDSDGTSGDVFKDSSSGQNDDEAVTEVDSTIGSEGEVYIYEPDAENQNDSQADNDNQDEQDKSDE